MYSIPWYVALLVSVPETFLVILVGFKLYDIEMPLSAGIVVSFIMGFAAYLIRLFPMPFGLHTVVQLFMMVVLMSLLARAKWWPTLISILTKVSKKSPIFYKWGMNCSVVKAH